MSKKEVDKKIKEITDKIVKEFQPEKIMLFGSYAWGNPGKDSDVDLFVVKSIADKNRRNLARKMNRSIFPRVFPVDLILYTKKQLETSLKEKDYFVNNIMSNGVELYAK